MRQKVEELKEGIPLRIAEEREMGRGHWASTLSTELTSARLHKVSRTQELGAPVVGRLSSTTAGTSRVVPAHRKVFTAQEPRKSVSSRMRSNF